MFSSVYRTTIEWGQCDPAGIVFYPRFFDLFDVASARLFQAASGLTRTELIHRHKVIGWPMVNVQAEFRFSVRYDDAVEIRTVVDRLGKSSLTLSHELLVGERRCVQAIETRVWSSCGAERNSIVPQPLPEDLRRRLEASNPEIPE